MLVNSTLENFPQDRNGQGSFLCVRAISSDRELTRQRKIPVRSRPEENYPEWQPALKGNCHDQFNLKKTA